VKTPQTYFTLVSLGKIVEETYQQRVPVGLFPRWRDTFPVPATMYLPQPIFPFRMLHQLWNMLEPD